MAKNQIIICLQTLYNSNKRVEEQRHTGGNACSIAEEQSPAKENLAFPLRSYV